MPHRRIIYRQEDKSSITYFPTGSKFCGCQNALGMQDYGMYVWPDGSRYVGVFCDNKFHGDGYIELSPPHNICYKVLHEHGKLKKIYNMAFTDYLQVDFTWHGDAMSFDNWNYCTNKNRLFCGEKRGQMSAVGPFKYKSWQGHEPPPLAPNIFDLGFGKFNRFGCVTEIPNHLSPTREFFVGCGETREWIQNNCRHGELDEIQLDPEVMADFTRQIIHNNVENDKQTVGYPHRELTASPRHSYCLCQRSSSESSLGEVCLHYDSSSEKSFKFEKRNIKTRRPNCNKCLYRKMRQEQRPTMDTSKMVTSIAETLINILRA
ncbi:uncharacterized protein LOC133842703 [Drosophila sulfurigaster albostrigata]|uniref:uncharacterized protein LOC133842703 n=1 Tax=Drosophila sulfurigaster albostrigata TaxID=89887 RepID=UPI002D21E93A|nr:uncharacterized protein LOC133842703 [Drosophila sulfurigaster albostrigata]